MDFRPYFPKEEFEARWNLAQSMMGEKALDAILATNAGNIFWLTGFEGSLAGDKFPEFSHDIVFPRVLLRREGEPVLFGVGIAGPTYSAETYCSDIRTYDAGADPAVVNRTKIIAEGLNSISGKLNPRVGIDLGCAEGITVPQWEDLRSAAPSVDWIDVTEDYYHLRMIKSEREINALRMAVDIQNRSFEKFLTRIRTGMSEQELMWVMTACHGECGATELGVAVPLTHPGNMYLRKQSPKRTMGPGDFQWFDAGAIFHGYTSDYTVLISYDEPNKEAVKTSELLTKIYEDGLACFVPGIPIAEIARNVSDVVSRHGAKDPLNGAFIGHNIGYDFTERPYLGRYSAPDLILRPGMVIAPEWFVETQHGLFLYEENFLVLEDRLEKLSTMPRQLHVIN